ncbi:50S ribosomal protein L1 [Candidatus Peregrinibacteria bacterium CG11_big_fil_rev_8_21_14_0_20_46_8]|nr:MAG: 50S ribosomal protein L1 [Candidatus Peregrinibacteria bacterium CG11_big_fil_rev_8_21_14_0_20_46_8]
MAHGKKYRNAKDLIEDRLYQLDEAIALLKKTATTKFDSSCEVHMNLGIDPRHADQIVRGTVAMPHGTGKKVRVIAFVTDARVKEAKDAGASEAGLEDLVKKIEDGWLDFDVAVAEPAAMKHLGKIAKTLGQKGLMPNPKAGTVTPEITKTIGEIIKGKVEFRVDKLANLHNIFGKASFDEAKLLENVKTYLKAIVQAKPSGAKGVYVKSLTLTTSMGPGIKIDPAATNSL